MDPGTLLRRVGFEQDGWTVEDLAHNRWLTPGIWQLHRGEERMALKWLSATRSPGETAWESHWSARSTDPTRWNYWAREALAYESDLPTKRFGGRAAVSGHNAFDAPKCIASEVTRFDAILLLEFVDGVGAEHWTIAQYGDAARALGLAHSRAAEPLEGWLSRGFIRDYCTEKPVKWDLLNSDAAWNQPLIAECFPTSLRELATTVHRRRNELLAILEHSPRVLCHLDFWTKNLIRRPTGKIALLDWAFVGEGALGEDIGNLIPDAAFDHFVPSAGLPQLEDQCITSYVSGLHAGGWEGDPHHVRRNTWASAVKYDWLIPLLLERASASTHMRYGGTEEVDAKFLFRERGLALEFALTRALMALDEC
jgi:hypothetical protein